MRFFPGTRWLRGSVWIAVLGVGWAAGLRSAPSVADPDVPASPAVAARRTPLVRLIERVAPSVVDITSLKRAGGNQFAITQGTGSILHESGYIITNCHVIDAGVRSFVTLNDGRTYPFRVVARLPYEDLALIKIEAGDPLRPVRLGRSHDLMLGEDVLAIGNPHGLSHTVAPGIISGLNRATGPTAAALQKGMIQTNAAVNPGNSGGPLFNALGEMIGIISRKKTDAENISFAITVDRLREVFPELMSVQQRYGFVLGMDVDTLAEPVKVTRVEGGSPAAAAEVCVGDQVLQAGEMTVRHGLDFYIALVDHRPGQPFPLKLHRDGKAISVTATLGRFAPQQPVTPKGLRNGLQFAVYPGSWDKLPNFDKLKPLARGVCNKFSHAVYPKAQEYFGLRFTGFLEVPADGLYFFYTSSDDGSRLRIGDRLVVDNDGLHATAEMGGLIRLSGGLYPIEVTFFEKTGEEELKVFYEGPRLPKREIPPEALFFKPAPQQR